MADEDDMFELPDSVDIDDQGFQRTHKSVISGDADSFLREIERGVIDIRDIRNILANSVTLFGRPGGGGRPSRPRPIGGGTGSFQIDRFKNKESTPFRFSFQNYESVTKPVEFFSRKFQENAKSGMVVLPVPPESVEISGGNSPEEVQSAAGIVFSHAGPLQPVTISFEGMFPHATNVQDLPNYVPPDTVAKGFYSPAALCAKFMTAMRAGQPLVFNICQPNKASKLLNSYTVVVTDFSWRYEFGHGLTRFYSMTLREWFPQRVLTIKHKKKPPKPGTGRPTGGSGGNNKPKPKHYTIVKGDSLWKIADKFYGDGRKWKVIYANADNKKALNKALKAHGQKLNNPNLIYPGTKLVIP